MDMTRTAVVLSLGWHWGGTGGWTLGGRWVADGWPMELRSRRVGTAYHADVSREGRSPWDRDNYW